MELIVASGPITSTCLAANQTRFAPSVTRAATQFVTSTSNFESASDEITNVPSEGPRAGLLFQFIVAPDQAVSVTPWIS